MSMVDEGWDAWKTQTGPYDPVEYPEHYVRHASGIEPIEITQHMNFCRGNAVKYIWRAGSKGDEVEDLRKAIWYLEKEIARLSTPPAAPRPQAKEDL